MSDAASPRGPLRILMVIHTHWSRNLGGPRVQMELGEELAKLGCRVEKLSFEDLFPEPARRPVGRVGPNVLGRALEILRANRSFSRRAIAWVRRHGGRFDVIDAHQTDLPVAKARLDFEGLLVARSVGLMPKYDDFERWAARRWPVEISPRQRLHALLTLPALRRRRRDVEPSFRHADLINVSSRDDLSTLGDEMGFGDKTVWFPFGLSAARRATFAAARESPAARLANATVAFIGTWNARKGARDWPAILGHLRARVPQARLLLLGTGLAEPLVRRDFPTELQEALTVVPSYESEALPSLLAAATVGAFPGYLEGFGFSVLEKLAAGLPTVVYDAPGPRDIVASLPPEHHVPPGETELFAERLAGWLTAPQSAYAAAAEASLDAAGEFSWEEIAARTLAVYRQHWERVKP